MSGPLLPTPPAPGIAGATSHLPGPPRAASRQTRSRAVTRRNYAIRDHVVETDRIPGVQPARPDHSSTPPRLPARDPAQNPETVRRGRACRSAAMYADAATGACLNDALAR